jgi:hypothetical protein
VRSGQEENIQKQKPDHSCIKSLIANSGIFLILYKIHFPFELNNTDMYTEKDLHDFRQREIDVKDIEEQLLQFVNGIAYLPVIRPATTGDGILSPRTDTLNDYINLYQAKVPEAKIIKFVPASGAASRMFKDLYAYIEGDGAVTDTVNNFITGIPEFAFYNDLKDVLAKAGIDLEAQIKSGEYKSVIKALLGKDGLNYSELPKGLLAFHKYEHNTRTAFEEHLAEGAMYCRGKDNEVNIHLTVSPEHQEAFQRVSDRVLDEIQEKYDLKFNVSFSTQRSSTDTIAVDKDNKPFRDKSGNLVFRPGGHGALLDNLAELDADVIFIKNIDNVVPDHLKEESVTYKKALGGMLFSFRERIFDCLNQLNKNTGNTKGLLEEIRIFLEEELSVITPWGHDQWTSEELRKYLISKLNRPLRVCGMVRNAGEPGGGPFWVKNADRSVSLQIVESSQINLSNPLMKKQFDASTHFNPVDLVCSVKDFNGNRFDLQRFRDPDTGFISSKSLDGKELKALELPGLWNGAMSHWITVFVEVPLSTFNPVKTINDLLRPQHRGL